MTRTLINEGWTFTKEGSTQTVSLPHTWNGLDGQDGGNDYYRGLCIYQKTMQIEASDDQVVHLEFEAANSVANVYVNDIHAGEHIGGYSTFRFNISSLVKRGFENVIRVEVDNSHREDVYPLMADFTFQGGLYRDAYLIVSEPLHIDLDDDGSSGIYVSQTSVSQERAELGVDVLVRNSASAAATGTCLVELLDAEGSTKASVEQSCSIDDNERLSLAISLDHPHLWQGVDDPYLYNLRVTLKSESSVVDVRNIPTGLRFFEVSATEGFSLNGKPWRLNGVSRHQCREDVGWALSPEHQDEDMALIEEVGANSIRLAHYQHNQYFYDLCDKVGMVIWAEIPYISITSTTDTTGSNALSQMNELVKQNYNHSAIIFWGIQNEITIGGKENNVEPIVQSLHDLTKKLDPCRPTVQAQVGHLPNEDSLNFVSDINAFNKYYGWYYKDVEDMGTWIDKYHRINPEGTLALSEYGAEGILTWHTDNPKKSDYTEEYHALYHEKALELFAKRPFLWGTYVWNMFDFAADQRDEGGVKGKNNKGLMTHDHQTRKDAFYIYQAHWSKKPMLHITAKRYLKRATPTISVKVYSNQPEVSLEVNGAPLATLTSDNHVFTFDNVPLPKEGVQVVAKSGGLRDEASFEKVAEPEASYVVPEGEDAVMGNVANWFDASLFEQEAPPLEFTDGCFSITDPIKDIIANPQGEAFLKDTAAALFDHPMIGFLKNMSFAALKDMKPESFPDIVLYQINEGLRKIEKG